MRLVGDRERERTAAALRRHYLAGRLSDDELGERVDRTLRARTRLDLLVAGRGLPGHALQELAGAPVRALTHAVLFVVLAAVWALVSLLVVVAFGVALAVHGATLGTLLGFPLAWAFLTWLLVRAWQRRGRAG